MAEIIRMPKLSDTMTEGVVSKWHKKIGETIKSGDLLADIETDKATMEFESFNDGVLLHIGVEEGATAPVNGILAILGKKGEDISKLLKEEAQKQEKTDEQPVQQKAEPEIEKPQQTHTPPLTEPAQQTLKTSASSSSPKSNVQIKASPLAKRLAKEKNIDLSRVKGTGDAGRIIKRDVESFSGGRFSNVSMVESSNEVAVSQMRKTIARRLAESKFSAPHFYLTIDIDMSEVIASRKLINEIAPSKISFNDIVIKAAARALQDHPAVNSAWLDDRIRYNDHVHIGVAIAVPDGLVVPVVKFANGKRLSDIASAVKTFAQKAKDKKLQPQDFDGSTFTISNLGMFGIEEFTAIINAPNSCIMAVGAIRETPVVKNGQLVIGQQMKVTLSCDHRTVDGASGAAFLNTFKKLLEHPVLLLGEPMI